MFLQFMDSIRICSMLMRVIDTEFALNVVGTTQFSTLVVSGTITAEVAGTASNWQHVVWFII